MNNFYSIWLRNHLSADEVDQLDGLPDATILSLYSDLLAVGPNTKQVQFAYQRYMAAADDDQEFLRLIRPIIWRLEFSFDAALAYKSWLRQALNPTPGAFIENQLMKHIVGTLNEWAADVAEVWRSSNNPELKSHINRLNFSRNDGVASTLLSIANQKNYLFQPMPLGMQQNDHISWQESVDVVMQGFQ